MNTVARSRILSSTRAIARAAMPAIALTLMLGACGRQPVTGPSGDAALNAATAPSTLANAVERQLKDTYLQRNWEVELPRPVHTTWISPQVPELLFVQLRETNEIYAIDAMSGNTRWTSARLPKPIDPRHPPSCQRLVIRGAGSAKGVAQTYNDDRLYLISDDLLFCIECVSGQVVWRYRLPFSASTGPLAIGPAGTTRIFIGDWDGRVQVVTPFPMPRQAWQFNVHGLISSIPVEREDIAYVTNHQGQVQSFRLDRGDGPLWSFKAGGPIKGSVAVRNSWLFVGSDDNILFALNRLDGHEIGHLNFYAPIRRAPFTFNPEQQRVYLWTTDADPALGGLWAVKTVPGKIPFTNVQNRDPREVMRMATEWYQPGLTKLVGSTPEHLLCLAPTGTKVAAVNRQSGKIDWYWNAAEERITAAKAARKDPAKLVHITQYHDATNRNRSIYTADTAGLLVSYRMLGYAPGDAAPVVAIAATADAEHVLAPKKAKQPAADAAKPTADAAKPADPPK